MSLIYNIGRLVGIQPEQRTILEKEQIQALQACFSNCIYIYLRFPCYRSGFLRQHLGRTGEKQKGREVQERTPCCRRPTAPEAGKDR